MTKQDLVCTWLGRAAQGDAVALQRLILLYHPRLRAIAAARITRRLRGKIDPDDVLQQVYIEAVQRIGEFHYRGRGSFLHWLRRLLDSRLADAHRRFHAARRDVRREVAEADRPSDYDRLAGRAALDTVTPSRIVRRQEAQALLMAALAGLPPDYRRVLELRFLKGCPLAEVAACMNRSPAAVQMLSGRALRRLRLCLRQLSNPP